MLCAGCVTLAPKSATPGPDAIVAAQAPVRRFESDRCGSGSLSVVLTALGDAVSEPELAAEIPRAPGGGVLSVDLLLAARQRGFSAALVAGDEAALAREIGEGRPAILMLRLLDLPGHKGDVYHYVVVDGHDPGRALFRVQFGDGRVRWTPLGRLEGAWAGGGHAMLTVSAPPAFAQLRAALALEQEGRLDEAAREYARILEQHPESLRASINLGNVEAARHRAVEAEAAYRQALLVSPEDPEALNNLAWLLLEQASRLEEAEALARAAAAQQGPDRALVLDTLGRVLSARGRCREAEATLAEALALPDLTAAARSQLEESRREAARGCSR